MGLMREYAYASSVAGDPFLGKAFKKLGGAVKKGFKGVARIGLGRIANLMPFGGPVSFALNLARKAGLTAGDFEDVDELMEWTRTQGYELGDPGKKKTPKRKQAAAGGKAKAAKKKETRKEKRKGGGMSGFIKGAKKFGGAAARVAGAALESVPGGAGLTQIGRELGIVQDPELAAAAAAAGGANLPVVVPAGGMGAMGGGFSPRGKKLRLTKKGVWTDRKRPAMQVTNTRALRKALTRVEGFGKLAKRVMPHLFRATGARRVGGHKPGCRCITCRRK